VTARRPMKDGVIADYETTATMIKYFMDQASKKKGLFSSKTNVMICVPSGITSVEKRAVEDAAKLAGAREAYTIEEPFAAAIGAGLPVSEPTGSMVVDIGGGTTEVAVISLGGIVTSQSIRVGGDEMDESIIRYIKSKYNLMIGERTAETLKMTIGYARIDEESENETMEIRGRDLVTGLPKQIEVTSAEICDALSDTVDAILAGVKHTLEQTPPELSADVMDRGIVLTGGGALLKNLDAVIEDETRILTLVAENALDCVAIGTGKSLEMMNVLRSKSGISQKR